MEKVLLAIDGTAPDKKAFSYAVELCTRIKAELNVLQIIRSQNLSGYLAKVKNTATQAKLFFEGTMAAAAFAEAGEHKTADDLMDEALRNIHKLLPESENSGVSCHLTMKSGDPKEEIVRFVQENKDVVIAVYDPTGENTSQRNDKKNQKFLQSITETLPIPLVVLQNNS